MCRPTRNKRKVEETGDNILDSTLKRQKSTEGEDVPVEKVATLADDREVIVTDLRKNGVHIWLPKQRIPYQLNGQFTADEIKTLREMPAKEIREKLATLFEYKMTKKMEEESKERPKLSVERSLENYHRIRRANYRDIYVGSKDEPYRKTLTFKLNNDKEVIVTEDMRILIRFSKLREKYQMRLHEELHPESFGHLLRVVRNTEIQVLIRIFQGNRTAISNGFGNNNAAVAVDYDEIIVVTDQAPLPKVPSPEVPLPKVHSRSPTPAEEIERLMQDWRTIIPEMENAPWFRKKYRDENERKIQLDFILSTIRVFMDRNRVHAVTGLRWRTEGRGAHLTGDNIDDYLHLICERQMSKDEKSTVLAINSHFFTNLRRKGYEGVESWYRNIKIFSFDIILVPIHIPKSQKPEEEEGHWCMAIIHMKNKTIKYYDSMGAPNDTALNALAEYLESRSIEEKVAFDMKDWQRENVQNIPRQTNGYDCGVFACMYAEYTTRGAVLKFTQADMVNFRMQMVYEICNGDLIKRSRTIK